MSDKFIKFANDNNRQRRKREEKAYKKQLRKKAFKSALDVVGCIAISMFSVLAMYNLLIMLLIVL